MGRSGRSHVAYGPLRRSNSFLLISLALTAAAATPAQALVIQPVYDKTITSLANAATIEAAFNAVAAQFSSTLSAPVTVKIGVSWGNVAGYSMGSNVGASLDPLSGAYTYAQIAAALQASSGSAPQDATLASFVANLPSTDPTGLNNFEIPYAEAQALGLINATISLNSGYVGFSSTAVFDFNPKDGVPKGTYDFQGIAAHEIAEVLGRITGLAKVTTWASPFDLARFSALGTTSFSYGLSGYLSVDGGLTSLGTFNASGGGDRSDWASGVKDAQNATLSGGAILPFSQADWTALDLLGWNSGSGSPTGPAAGAPSGYAMDESRAPEPGTWAIFLIGFGFCGTTLRQHRLTT